MAIYRNVQMTFWTDAKVVDNFTPEDRYFYLYLLTNPHTNLCGCYEISFKQISDETGYTKEVVERLLERMENVHNVIRYSRITKELLMINWSKFNWTKSNDFQKCLKKEIASVKCQEFKDYLSELVDGVKTVPRPSLDGVGTTVTVTDISKDLQNTKVEESDTNSLQKTKVKDTKLKDTEDILDYLNLKAGKHFTIKNKYNIKTIRERLAEGYTVDDFKKIIDTKTRAWLNTENQMYLRPETLFCPKHFESYLNEASVPEPPRYENKQEEVHKWTEEDYEAAKRYLDSLGDDEDDV